MIGQPDTGMPKPSLQSWTPAERCTLAAGVASVENPVAMSPGTLNWVIIAGWPGLTTWQRITCASTSAQFCTTLPATVMGLVNPAMTWPSAEIGTP